MTRRSISLHCCPKLPPRHPNPPPRACTTHTPLVGRNCASEAVCSTICTRISTHTPLAGRDSHLSCSLLHYRYFYSHAPRGARQELADLVTERIQFLLTRPSRGATCRLNHLVRLYPISTHTPLAGRDKIRLTKWPRRKISTHTPLAGRDNTANDAKSTVSISTHTPLAGRDYTDL